MAQGRCRDQQRPLLAFLPFSPNKREEVSAEDSRFRSTSFEDTFGSKVTSTSRQCNSSELLKSTRHQNFQDPNIVFLKLPTTILLSFLQELLELHKEETDCKSPGKRAQDLYNLSITSRKRHSISRGLLYVIRKAK